MKSKKNRIIILVSLLLLMISMTLNHMKNIRDRKMNNINEFKMIKSGNLSTDYKISTVLEDIEKFDLNTINLPIVINIDDLSSTNMTIDKYSKEKGIKLIKILNNKGIQIILEPYPWIANGSEYETDWNPSDINDFFWNWKNDVLKVLIDELAVPYNIGILNIGTGFDHMEYAHGYWLDLIDYVRENYKGLITYRTSWWVTANWDPASYKDYEDKLHNPLFDELDFISIAAYFELTDQDKNSVENLVKAINSTQIFNRKQNIKKEIKAFQEKWDKSIFLGELGFPRTIKASIHPWNPFQSSVIDNKEQANCFEAYRRVFEDENWIAGFSIFSIGEKSDDKLYYPSDESTFIIRKWYGDSSQSIISPLF